MIDWPWIKSERGLHKRAEDVEARIKNRLADVENHLQLEVSNLGGQLATVMRDIQDGAERSESDLVKRLESIENDYPKFRKVVIELREANKVLHDRVSYLESKIMDLEFVQAGTGVIDSVSSFVRRHHLAGIASVLLLLASLGFSWLLITNM